MPTMNDHFQRCFVALCGAMFVLANAGLASTIINGLGLSANAADFRYAQPQLAGGVDASANSYTAFLRKLSTAV